MTGGRSAVAERMVDAAIDLIDQRGEAGLRVADVARQAGISTAKLYQVFEDREALVIAAQRERFERAFDQSIDEFRMLAMRCTTPEAFRDLTLAVMSQRWADQRSEARAARISVVGAALTRPTLLEAVNARHRDQVDQVAGIIVDARRRGFLTRDDNPRAVASWVLSVVLGRYLVEMGSPSVSIDRWDAMATEAVRVVMFGEPVDRAALVAVDPGEMRMLPPETAAGYADVAPTRLAQVRNATAERILAWAIEQIEARGEVGLRVSELEDAAGISPTSIYLHFENRDGLVQAAQFARLSRTIGPLVTAWSESMGSARRPEDGAAAIRQTIALLTGESHAAVRRQWLSVFASAHGRPALAMEVVERLDLCFHAAAASLDEATDNGAVPLPVDAPALVAWVVGMLIGRSVFELFAAPADLECWDAYTTRAALAMVGLPAH